MIDRVEIKINIDQDLYDILLAHFEKVQAQPDALQPLTAEQCIEMLIESMIKEIAYED